MTFPNLWKSLAGGAGVAGATVGVLVLIGWLLDVAVLKSLHPSLVSMKANTAIGFLFAGMALWLKCHETGVLARPLRRLARILAGAVVLIGLFTLLQYISGTDLGIDQLLFREPAGAVGTLAPGRMAPATALCFVLVGCALIANVETDGGGAMLQYLAAVTVIPALASALGYLYGASNLYGIGYGTQMAVHTALAFLVIAAGMLCLRPDRGVIALVRSDDTGGVVARRLIPAGVVLPTGIGWLRAAGERAGLFETEFGVALVAITYMVAFLALTFWIVRALGRIDALRSQAEAEISALNASLEQRVRERTHQLETATRELDAFSYSVSHDLRAPLRGIDGWSLALAEDYGGQLDEKAHGYLDLIRSEAQRMGQLIDDLLQLSRVSGVKMRRVPVNLSDLAQVVAQRLRQSQPGRHVEFEIQPGLCASGDARLLEIALTNLFSNAWKFTGPRPEARVEFCSTLEQDPETKTRGNAFFVRDNGVGFDMAHAQKLFGAFQRMHKASEFPGTGIGLATVLRIVHRHQGHIWADAQAGRGATFYFTLAEAG